MMELGERVSKKKKITNPQQKTKGREREKGRENKKSSEAAAGKKNRQVTARQRGSVWARSFRCCWLTRVGRLLVLHMT